MAESISRITFFDNGDLRYHAQVQALSSPTLDAKSTYAFTITSQKRLSKAPSEELVKFLVCLSKSDLLRLSGLIQRAVAAAPSEETAHGLL